MRVSFDALDRFETPILTVCNPGSKYVNGQLTNAVGCLFHTSDEEIVFNFNESSELNFRAYNIKDENSISSINIYDCLKNRRLIFVNGIGYFVITEVNETRENGGAYKDITASSIDSEMEQKIIPYIEDGTYKFDDLMEKLVAVVPMWTIGDVASTIQNRYRTFEDVSTDTNVLSFMISDMQDAYECIFIFDIINRKINVYDQNNYVVDTSIHLTLNDLISSAEISESSDDIYTAISVFGESDDIIISPINPTGTSVLYNFDYYLKWMSDELSTKVSTWQDFIESKLDEYYELNLAYYKKLDERITKRQDISACQIILNMYQKMRDNMVASGNTSLASEYNDVIEENGGTVVDITQEVSTIIADIDALIETENSNLSTYTSELETIDEEIDSYSEPIQEIRNACSITEYFTEDEYAELYNYIFEGSYSDEYITVTDSMTYEEKFAQMKTLYDRARTNLEKVSTPTTEYSLDVENFIFSKEFKKWSDQIETGCLINVDLDNGEVMLLLLNQMTINYSDCSLSLTFGNKFNKYDPKSLFEDVLGSVSKSANTLNYVKDILYPVKTGELDSLQQQMKDVRNITMQNALLSTNEDVLIDGSGITTRRSDGEGGFEDEQVKITGESIVFTDDSWKSCKTALGKIIFNGEAKYGLNAEYIYGDIINGETANITNINASDIIVGGDVGDRVALDTYLSDIEASAKETAESTAKSEIESLTSEEINPMKTAINNSNTLLNSLNDLVIKHDQRMMMTDEGTTFFAYNAEKGEISDCKIVITSDRISLRSSDSATGEQAYITQDGFVFKNGILTDTLTIGENWMWTNDPETKKLRLIRKG